MGRKRSHSCKESIQHESGFCDSAMRTGLDNGIDRHEESLLRDPEWRMHSHRSNLLALCSTAGENNSVSQCLRESILCQPGSSGVSGLFSRRHKDTENIFDLHEDSVVH